MKELWSTVQLAFAAVGGWLGWFLGGCDGLLYALLAFTVIDYITGVFCAISDKKLSSAVGFRGICRKLLIYLLVGIAQLLICERAFLRLVLIDLISINQNKPLAITSVLRRFINICIIMTWVPCWFICKATRN